MYATDSSSVLPADTIARDAGVGTGDAGDVSEGSLRRGFDATTLSPRLLHSLLLMTSMMVITMGLLPWLLSWSLLVLMLHLQLLSTLVQLLLPSLQLLLVLFGA